MAIRLHDGNPPEPKKKKTDRAAAFGRLTGYYERARFGDAPLSDAERQDVARSLAALAGRS